MKKFKVITYMLLNIAISTTITGCGGGGGSETPRVAPSAPAASAAPTSQSQAETDKTDLQQLKIASDNSLSLTQTMNVSVKTNTDRAYLSICLAMGEEVSVGEIDYSECIVRTSLKNEYEEMSFSIANHVESLVAVIWYFNNDREPFVARWQREESSSNYYTLSWSLDDSE